MDLALIQDGAVTAVAKNSDDSSVFGDAGQVVAFAPGSVVVGMLWDGTSLSEPDPVVTVPASVSMRQARLALLAAGLLDQVEAAIANQSQAVQIEWEYATDIHRSRDLVASLGTALELTDEQIDALFIAARAIP